MLFPVTAVAIACLLLWSVDRYGGRNALTLGLGTWTVSVLLSIVPVLRFNVDYSVRADLFAAGCIASLSLAYIAVRRRPLVPPASPLPRLERKVTRATLWVGLGGCGLLLLNAWMDGTPLSVTGLIGNLADVREFTNDPTEQLARGTQPMFLLGVHLAAFAYVGMLATVLLGRARVGRSTIYLACASFVGVAAVSLLVFAGRTILFNGALLLLVGFYLAGKKFKVKPRTIVVGIFVVIAAWFFSVSYFTAREGTNFNTRYYLKTLERAEVPDYLKPTVARDPNLGSALVSYGYFASPLPSLSWYVQQRPTPGPYWGSYSYPLLTQLEQKLVGAAQPWTVTRRQIFDVMEKRGYAGNIWPTWLRDLLVDWGYFGAMVFCGLFGAFMAWARNRYERTGLAHYFLLESIAALTFAFGAFQNLLWVNVYQTVLIAALVFWAAVAVLRPARMEFKTPVHVAAQPSLAKRHPAAVPVVAFGVWLALVVGTVSLMQF